MNRPICKIKYLIISLKASSNENYCHSIPTNVCCKSTNIYILSLVTLKRINNFLFNNQTNIVL